MDLVVILGFIAVGLWMVVGGIRVSTGRDRSWFYVHRTPTIVMPNIVFGLIPGGAGTLLLGLLMLSSYLDWIKEQGGAIVLGFAIAPLWGIGLIFLSA